MTGGMNKEAFIALGSNIEPRFRTMVAALHLLERSTDISVNRVSSVFLSEAHTQDGSVQKDYLNAVALVDTRLDAQALLDRCLKIEHMLGRNRRDAQRWAPRRIDLDILLHSDGKVESDNLKIPHPRMGNRSFVLRPLAELVDGHHFFRDLGETMSGLLERCSDTGKTVKTVAVLHNFE